MQGAYIVASISKSISTISPVNLLPIALLVVLAEVTLATRNAPLQARTNP